MLLGVIADDFTGATDIAGFLVAGGMRTVQLNGVPKKSITLDTDAIVISLKSRSCPVEDAEELSRDSLVYLQEQGCEQIFFKYCSTFDSTAKGNIGPVTDVLLEELNDNFTILCPSLPVNGRTVFNGYLFVGDQLLSDSGMRNHPVTPMTDSSLIHLMEKQAKGRCGLVSWQVIDKGPAAVQARFTELKEAGFRYAVVDAFCDKHLETLGEAVKGLPLVTGGSGLAAGIAHARAGTGVDAEKAREKGLPFIGEKTVIFSGSCSEMTNKQVAVYAAKAESFALDVEEIIGEPDACCARVAEWLTGKLDSLPAPLVFATVPPEKLKEIQAKHGSDNASEAVEQFFRVLTKKMAASGVKNFIVAGGETSGVVAQSLNIDGFYIGPQIAPGVPWVHSINDTFALALKSGNFGDEKFFEHAQEWING